MQILEPTGLEELRASSSSNQPDANQTKRGTVFARCWSGDKAPIVAADSTIELSVQRDPDQGATIDDEVPFGLAVTLTMPGVIEIYDQVRQRLAVLERARA